MTPMSKAVLDLFGNLDERLKEEGVRPGSVHAYLFGGCAVHFHVSSRASRDVDTEFAISPSEKEAVQLVIDDLPAVPFDDPDLGAVALAIDRNFNTTLGPLHEDYRERATVLCRGTEDSPLTVWLPSAADIAVSKLGRFFDVDIRDISMLVTRDSWEEFEKLATEAYDYFVGNRADLTSKLSYVRSNLEGDRK